MEDIRYKDKNGNIMNISVIGTFKISDLEKEYIMYSIEDDDKENEYGYMLLGEIITEGNDKKITGINKEEEEIVLAYYNEIANQMGN